MPTGPSPLNLYSIAGHLFGLSAVCFSAKVHNSFSTLALRSFALLMSKGIATVVEPKCRFKRSPAKSERVQSSTGPVQTCLAIRLSMESPALIVWQWKFLGLLYNTVDLLADSWCNDWCGRSSLKQRGCGKANILKPVGTWLHCGGYANLRALKDSKKPFLCPYLFEDQAASFPTWSGRDSDTRLSAAYRRVSVLLTDWTQVTFLTTYLKDKSF